MDFIVFAPNIANCYINEDTLNKLNSIITANTYVTKSGPLLFFNAKGPGSSALGDEIFIDCKPIDKSSEQTKITKTTSSSNTFDINSITQSPLFQILVSSLLFIFIIFIFSMFIKGIGKS